mgnify:CR=1 FL=1
MGVSTTKLSYLYRRRFCLDLKKYLSKVDAQKGLRKNVEVKEKVKRKLSSQVASLGEADDCGQFEHHSETDQSKFQPLSHTVIKSETFPDDLAESAETKNTIEGSEEYCFKRGYN